MATIYLVRHARPKGAWSEDPDPGLDDVGVAQAAAAAQTLHGKIGSRLPIRTSPLLRCRETAAPLIERWRSEAEIMEAVAEIPAPAIPAGARREWLAQAMRGTWSDLQSSAAAGAPDYARWRMSVLEALARLDGDHVVFTHFIAINVVVGAALGNDRVVSFKPDHASITRVSFERDTPKLIELGREAETLVAART
jgi:broad specificity phosphatase PhoE